MEIILLTQEPGRQASSGELIEEKAETEQVGEKQTVRLTYYKQQAPRLFICHADGSGTELLRYQVGYGFEKVCYFQKIYSKNI